MRALVQRVDQAVRRVIIGQHEVVEQVLLMRLVGGHGLLPGVPGRGNSSIGQQRYNGQFGGDAFWEIEDGKKTRMASDVTCNAITADFWNDLDALAGAGSWEMFGATGDAKGQPVQINYPSHGSPWFRIRRVMVGAADS